MKKSRACPIPFWVKVFMFILALEVVCAAKGGRSGGSSRGSYKPKPSGSSGQYSRGSFQDRERDRHSGNSHGTGDMLKPSAPAAEAGVGKQSAGGSGPPPAGWNIPQSPQTHQGLPTQQNIFKEKPLAVGQPQGSNAWQNPNSQQHPNSGVPNHYPQQSSNFQPQYPQGNPGQVAYLGQGVYPGQTGMNGHPQPGHTGYGQGVPQNPYQSGPIYPGGGVLGQAAYPGQIPYPGSNGYQPGGMGSYPGSGYNLGGMNNPGGVGAFGSNYGQRPSGGTGVLGAVGAGVAGVAGGMLLSSGIRHAMGSGNDRRDDRIYYDSSTIKPALNSDGTLVPQPAHQGISEGTIIAQPAPQGTIAGQPDLQGMIPAQPVLQGSFAGQSDLQGVIPSQPVAQGTFAGQSDLQGVIPSQPVAQGTFAGQHHPHSVISAQPIPQDILPAQPVPQGTIIGQPVTVSTIIAEPVPQESSGGLTGPTEIKLIAKSTYRPPEATALSTTENANGKAL